MKNTYDLDCGLSKTLNILGDKWTLLVLHRILCGTGVFKELQESLKTIPTNLLSQRLKLLEEHGFIKAELYVEHPPRYRYLPTEKGESFKEVFNVMSKWSHHHLANCSRTLCHTACGNEAELRFYCPRCDTYTEQVSVMEATK